MTFKIISIVSIFVLPVIAGWVLGSQYLGAQHRERMGLINQGIIPPQKESSKKMPNRYYSLRNGIILTSLGIGIIVGFICVHNLAIAKDITEFLIIVSSIVLFLGLGFLAFFGLTKNMPTEEENQQPE
ncbi:MAG: hypothetical protein LBS52_05720 [Dysgonamonadaceae bacterium]|jgi:hypothetical protein|nr:hypothetical protein [Dysgonamonadaceae bacterium]